MVKCSEVLQCSDLLFVVSSLSFFVCFVNFCFLVYVFIILFPSVRYVNLFSCLCIIVMYALFPCFSLRCEVNATVYLAKTGHGPHRS